MVPSAFSIDVQVEPNCPTSIIDGTTDAFVTCVSDLT